MANIRQYTSEKASEGLHPNDMGADAWEQAGRSINYSMHQLGETLGEGIRNVGNAIDQHDTMAEISKGAASTAQMMDDLSNSWANTVKNADPNDPNVAKNWREKVLEPSLDKYNEGFTTKQSQMWALEQQDHLRQHFFEKSAADQSTLAGDALAVNISSIGNHATNTAKNDPASIDTIHGMVRNSIDALVASTPNLSPEDASKARTVLAAGIQSDVATSAVYGAADKNPDAARTLLQSPSVQDHLDGEKVTQLGNYIDSQQRASASAAREAKADQDRQDRQNADAISGQITAKTIGADGGVVMYPGIYSDIVKLSVMPQAGELGRSMLDWAQSQQDRAAKGVPAVTDPGVYSDFLSRANLPASDPHALTLQEVYNASAASLISDKDFSRFRGWVAEAGRNPQRVANQKVLNQYFAGMKQYLTKSNMLTNDAYGNQKYMEFQQTMQERFDAGIAGGKSALSLVKPGSADYIGGDITRFQVSPDTSMAGTIAGATGNVTPLPATNATKWKPGMSMGDLDKAVNGGK